MDDQNSIVLDFENGSTTIPDISLPSDTLPSISFDENYQGKDFFLKELNDKISKLKKENFDLKMKLYLLESNDNLLKPSELKLKFLHEFDRKNEEIRILSDMVASKEKENLKLLSRNIPNDYKQLEKECKKLKSKLIEMYRAYFELYNHANQLKDLLSTKSNQIDQLDHVEFTDKMITSKEIIEKANKFLSENSIKNLLDFNEEIQFTQLKHVLNRTLMHDQCVQTENKTSMPKFNIQQQQIHPCLFNIQQLIEKFRNNEINFKTFLSKLDEIFDQIQLLDHQYSNMKYTNDNQNDVDEFKLQILVKLNDQLKKLELLNENIETTK